VCPAGHGSGSTAPPGRRRCSSRCAT
jgi:hypothetical protein